jgi:hypothetical protein
MFKWFTAAFLNPINASSSASYKDIIVIYSKTFCGSEEVRKESRPYVGNQNELNLRTSLPSGHLPLYVGSVV